MWLLHEASDFKLKGSVGAVRPIVPASRTQGSPFSRAWPQVSHKRQGGIFVSQVWNACGILKNIDFWRFNMNNMFPLPEGKNCICPIFYFTFNERFVTRPESCMQQNVTLPRQQTCCLLPPQVLCGFDDKEFPMPDAWRESCQMCLGFGKKGKFEELRLLCWFWFSVILHPFCTKTHSLHMGFIQNFRSRELCEGGLAGMENLF